MVKHFRIIFYAASVILAAYAFLVEPYWVETTRVSVPELNGIRVVQISDLHLMDMDLTALSALSKTKEESPDLILLTGDMIDHPNKLKELEKFLMGLPDVPKIAIFGNWEYGSRENIKRLKEVFQKNHVKLLIDEETSLKVKNKTISIYGMDDYSSNPTVKPKNSFNNEDDFRIVLQHSPGFFDQEHNWGKNPNLCLSGHTHGGQVTLFGWQKWTPPGSGSFVYGEYHPKDCDRLFVSRGVGTSMIPVRMMARPEVVLFH